jgi:hypothetical protein
MRRPHIVEPHEMQSHAWMSRGGLLPAACALAGSFGCAPPVGSDRATAAEIERQVVAAHHGLSLDRYARFYAREADGSVRAIWLFADKGHEPMVGKAGQSVWTAPGKLPVVEDGGCAVLTIRYDAAHKRPASVECNGAG